MAVTRYPGGISTADNLTSLGDYGLPDPLKWHTYFNDFDTYVAGDWTITATGAGTVALTTSDGGAVIVTNAAADDDAVFLDKVGSGFLMAAGKKAFFKTRFKVSDATQSDVVFGLQVTDTTPLSVTDGIYFLKADGAATFDIFVRKDATTGSNTVASVATLVDDTFITLSWYYDGKSTVFYYVNNVMSGSLSATSTYLPDTTLTVSFGLQNGEAVAKTMTVDYLFAAKQR